MNKIHFILLVSFCTTIFKANAQALKTTSSMGKQHTSAKSLLLKSKKQKTTAWILLGAGAGVSIAGYIVTRGTVYFKDLLSSEGWDLEQTETGSIISLAGGAIMLASVPFFIISGKDRKKANLIIKNESSSFSRQLHSKVTFYSAGIHIKL